jgi:hypothetical protein
LPVEKEWNVEGKGSSSSTTTSSAIELKAVGLACTVGQLTMGGGLNPKRDGQEGPHTLLFVKECPEGPPDKTSDGSSGGGGGGGAKIEQKAANSCCRLYTFGTCHKGLCGNLAAKTLQAPFDELVPYWVGSKLRDVVSPTKKAKPKQKQQEKKQDGDTAATGVKGEEDTYEAGTLDSAAAEEKREELAATAGSGDNKKKEVSEQEEDEQGEVESFGEGSKSEELWPRKRLLGNVVGGASSSIHNLVWNDKGELWAFGEGHSSNQLCSLYQLYYLYSPHLFSRLCVFF